MSAVSNNFFRRGLLFFVAPKIRENSFELDKGYLKTRIELDDALFSGTQFYVDVVLIKNVFSKPTSHQSFDGASSLRARTLQKHNCHHIS